MQVNRLFGISGQQGPAPELTTLDGGRLFLVRPDSPKGARECIFIDASLSVRRTTHPHMFQLVVTRAFHDGEEQLLDDDAESSDERSFLLDASLFLSLGPSLDPAAPPTPAAAPSAPADPPLSFTWLDPDGDGPDDEFEFVLPSDGTVSERAARDFERLCWRCMWERREGREWPADDREAAALEDQLEDDFRVERAPAPAAPTPLYPSLAGAASAPATPSRPSAPASTYGTPVGGRPAGRTPAKTPLFRATSPEEESDDDAPALRACAPPRPDSDHSDDDEAEQSFATGLGDGDDESGDDSADELAAQLQAKAVLSPPAAPSPSKDKGKGKGKATAAPPTAVDDALAPALRKPPAPPAPPATAAGGEPTPILTVLASLHLYDRATGLFMQQDAGVKAGLYKLPAASGGGHWLVVESAETEGEVWVSQAVGASTTVNFAERERAMVFNYTAPPAAEDGAPGETFTWLLRLEADEAFARLQEAVSAALFEDKHGAGAWRKMKDEEREYARKAWLEEDEEMWDAEAREDEAPEEEDEEEEESEEEPAAPASESEDEDSDDDRRAPSAARAFSSRQPKQLSIGEKRRAKNSQLAVGYKDDLSFVVQGDMIGVFKQQREGGKKLKFVTSIVNIAAPGKKNFTPGKVMLHSQDTSMILQNPLAPGSLYRLDLETGKVVDELQVSSDFGVTNFLPDSKFAQTTQQQTFIGHSSNGLFRIDPRLAGSKLVESEFKQYATKAAFSAAATTEAGKIAVASAKGDIRLYDKLGKMAKTALPALGDAVLGIDVSADGRWVLATCKTYLLLIDTQIPDGATRNAGRSGFDAAFPAAEKPTPRRLTLRPEHVAHMQEVQGGEGVCFTPAKFNAALTGEPERTIVTSTGPFIVAWNFRQVKAGNTHNYTLRRFSDDVVADNFKFGGDREIIVTLPENVFVEEKKKLKAPTRDSIVQTWDGR
ncbi:Vacuolar import and degradation protein 27 [Rhodotorula kratochvilovae]